mgnify:CR=1 FL=1
MESPSTHTTKKEDLRERYSGWETSVDHPQRYAGWETQAAHLHTSYNVPEKRACVVALKQAGAPGTDISAILGITEGTVSNHFSQFRESLTQYEDLLDVMGPHPWEGHEGYDPNMWLSLARVSYGIPDSDGIHTLKLFYDRVGNAVEEEYLLVDRKTAPTDIAGEVSTTVTRSAMSGHRTVISKLTRGFREDITVVANLALVYNGYFDPDGAPHHHTSLRDDRIEELVHRISGDTEGLVDQL